jgi:hypothetical protein
MSSNSNGVNNFNMHYNDLDQETQIRLDHFLAGIEEVGQHIVGETHFEGGEELLSKFMPCLKEISSSVHISGSYENGNNKIYKLSWTPNDMNIPADVLLRAIDRITNVGKTFTPNSALSNTDTDCSDIDDSSPLVRTCSSAPYNYMSDDVPSSM